MSIIEAIQALKDFNQGIVDKNNGQTDFTRKIDAVIAAVVEHVNNSQAIADKAKRAQLLVKIFDIKPELYEQFTDQELIFFTTKLTEHECDFEPYKLHRYILDVFKCKKQAVTIIAENIADEIQFIKQFPGLTASKQFLKETPQLKELLNVPTEKLYQTILSHIYAGKFNTYGN
jgi:tellurite resistance protein